MSAKIACAVIGIKQGLETTYALLHHPVLELKVVCDLDPEPFGWFTGKVDPEQSKQDYPHIPVVRNLLTELRQTPGREGVEWLTDFQAVLKRKDIQAILIFTPDGLHERFTIEALEAGKYVLCTKPMALTLESAQRIAAVARRHPHRYMLGFQFTYTPWAKQVMAVIRSGEVGTVRQLSFQHHRGPFRPVYRQKAASGGTIMQECCHWLDILYLLNGQSKFVKLCGFGGLDVHRDIQDIEDNGIVLLEYENKVRASLQFTYFRRTTHQEFFSVNGDQGQIRGTYNRVWVESDAGARSIDITGNKKLPGLIHEGYYEMHDEFAAMIAEDREPYSGWEAGIENMLISEAAQKAVDSGGIVTR